MAEARELRVAVLLDAELECVAIAVGADADDTLGRAAGLALEPQAAAARVVVRESRQQRRVDALARRCLLYTSDAADE